MTPDPPVTAGEPTPDAVAERLFSAIEAGDIDAVRALYAPDVAVWHNHDGLVQSLDDNVRVLGWMTRHLPGARYTDVRRSLTESGFVQQHVLVATNRAGREVAVPACIVADVADGRITRLDEYLDSAHIAQLMEAPPR
jgi:ketosteroid isomerase-like protein